MYFVHTPVGTFVVLRLRDEGVHVIHSEMWEPHRTEYGILVERMKYGVHIRTLAVLAAVFACASIAFADQTSENYQLTIEQIDSGGDSFATSSNFILEGTMGPFVSGDLQSETHTLGTGAGAGSIGGGVGENQVSPEISSVIFSYTDNGTALGFSTGIMPGIGLTTVHVYGTAIDANGSGTIANVAATLYRSGVAGGAGCSTDSFNCYRVTSCTVTPTTSFAAHYDCVFSVAGHADATDLAGLYPSQYWTTRVTVTDTSSFSSAGSNDIEMNSVAALSIPTTVQFGTMLLGSTTSTSTNRSLEIVQIGNAVSDLMLSSNTNLTCSQSGFIPKGNLKWSITNVGYASGSSTSFTSTPVQALLNVPRKTSSATSSRPLYFNIGIPAEGVGGVCSGTVLLNVIQSS